MPFPRTTLLFIQDFKGQEMAEKLFQCVSVSVSTLPLPSPPSMQIGVCLGTNYVCWMHARLQSARAVG